MMNNRLSYYALRLCCLFAVLLSGAAAHGEEYALHVELQNDSVTIHLDRKPEVTFDGIHVNIVANDNFQKSYEYAEVVKIYFENSITTGIAPSSGSLGFYYLNNESVRLTGLKGTEKIALYDASGRMLQMPFHGSTGDMTISIAHLNRGAYIIQIDKQSYKIFKR